MHQAQLNYATQVSTDVLRHIETTPSYQVRLATEADLNAVFALRYKVFFEELGAHTANAALSRKDVDEYDAYCDHIIVTQGEEVVGTYRLLPVHRLPKFIGGCYSENEFQMSSIRQHFADNALELGRSCIDANHRNGSVAKLLWAGIVSYINTHKPSVLFGCVSIHHLSHCMAQGLKQHFIKTEKWDNRFETGVTQKYATPEYSEENISKEAMGIAFETHIPPLLNSYLNIGAKLAAGPAWDAEFNCHDFLIVLETKNISEKYLKFLGRLNLAGK